ncbi:MAG: restriction endonuclease [Proteobacteria bacterium]|nr:restriction endonuclease [Pseudomonadota bacterium]
MMGQIQRKKKRRKKKKKGRGWIGMLVVFVLISAGGVAWIYRDYWRWYVAGSAAVAVIWLFIYAKRHRIASTMSEVDRMTGVEFERFLVKLFKRLNYKARHVGASSGDFGADLIVEKAGVKIAVQAKNYDSNRVGNDAVQQAIAGASYYDCAEAMVVTNSAFTKAAKQQAEGSNLPVSLWDRKILEKAIKGRSP